MWTAADQAELDVLLWTLVDAYFTHRELCAKCVERNELGSLPCPQVQRAIEEVGNWHLLRSMRSRAEHLRAIQEAA